VVDKGLENEVFSHLEAVGEKVDRIGQVVKSAQPRPRAVITGKGGALGYNQPWQVKTGEAI
ncbi:MAG: hypothetical protein IIC07_01910, partial [Proteobacteria bacterium]|nr:hypothetical protein [Pseudomonadota bacterium]